MFRATPEALQRRRLAARGLSTEARKMPREYLASVPKSRNFVVAGVLIGFAGGVYMYTVQRIQTVRVFADHWGYGLLAIMGYSKR